LTLIVNNFHFPSKSFNKPFWKRVVIANLVSTNFMDIPILLPTLTTNYSENRFVDWGQS